MLTRRYQLLLLAAIVLAAYYPASIAGFSRIDDGQLEKLLQESDYSDLWHYFIPGSGSLYYRPLIAFSYLIDKSVLGIHPGLMHLENILLHLANAVLVYFLTLYFTPPAKRNNSFAPLIAALLFGLHPVNTESVNWISGRTDVLAATFILISVLCLLKYRADREHTYAWLSFAAFVFGILAKETALAVMPGGLLLLFIGINKESSSDLSNAPEESSRSFSHLLLILGFVTTVLFLVYLPRSETFTSYKTPLGKTVIAATNDYSHSLFVVLRALGFYLKKLVFPYPLNFAIMDLDPLYEILAVPFIGLCIYMFYIRTLLSVIFLISIMLIAPSFVLAFGQIAWTPYAERYIYMTSAFFISALVVYFAEMVRIRKTIINVTVICLLAVFFFSTLTRSAMWLDDMKLIQDTLEKSPAARDIRLLYANLLTEKGDYAAAIREINQAKQITFLGYDERVDLYSAIVFFKQRKIEDAIAASELAVKRSNGSSITALKYLIGILEEKRDLSKLSVEKRALNRRIFALAVKLFKMNHNPHLLYSLAEIAEELGEQKRAIRLYQQARNNLFENDPVRNAAIKKITMLSK